MFEGLIAKIALGALWGRVKTNAVHDWQAIPPKARTAILIALAAIALFFVHQHFAHRALKAQFSAGYKQAQKDDAETALNLKAQIDALNVTIANQQRKIYDAQVARNSAAADALRVRGPGKASCTVYSGGPSGAGGHIEAAAAGDAAVGQVPDRTGTALIAMPFNDALGFAQAYDDLLAEAAAWRGQRAAETASLATVKVDGDKPPRQ